MVRALKLLLLALVLAALYVLFAKSEAGVRFVAWVEGAGAWGALVFAAAYVVLTVLFLPGSLLTLGAGFLYGPLWGTLLVSPASLAGATLAFLLAKGRAREWVEKKLAEAPSFAAVDRAIAERAWLTVFLLRLSPVVPFSLLNYALGLTKVRLGSYVGASFVGMLPGTLLYVYLGSLMRSVAELAHGGPAEGGQARQLLLWGGLFATLLVIWVIARASRRALQKELARKT